MIPGNDLDRLEKELAKREYAIIILESGGGHMAGQVRWDADFVRAIPGLTQQYGTVFFIDEVVTGFRDSPGSWQAIVGVEPDLTSFGKFMEKNETKVQLCLHLLHRGVATMRGRFFIFSAAHTNEDIDQTIKAFGDSLDTMVAEGALNKDTGGGS